MGLMSCEDATRRRCRIEMQGFTGLDDRTIQQIDPWIRLAPALCMVWTAVGTAIAARDASSDLAELSTRQSWVPESCSVAAKYTIALRP